MEHRDPPSSIGFFVAEQFAEQMSRCKRVFIVASVGLLTFALGVTLAVLRRHLPAREPTPWQTLISLENQDLANLRPESALLLERSIETLTGLPVSKDSYQPRLFRTMLNGSGETRYVLVEYRPLLMIPGESRLRIHVFDLAGHLLSQSDFSAGYRTTLTAINMRRDYFSKRDVLIVFGEYCFGGNPSEQNYVLVGNSIMLSYLEVNGEFRRNAYLFPFGIGPRFSQRTADDWETALNSSDRGEVAAALIWLGGQHWNGEPGPYDEDKPEAQKVSTLLARPVVKQRLNELSQLNDPWLYNGAKQILQPDSR